MTFIHEMTEAVRAGAGIDGVQVIVDAIYSDETPVGDFVSIDFHLRGKRVSKAQFSYTFSSADTVSDNLQALRDFVENQAYLPDAVPTINLGVTASGDLGPTPGA
jgi:hypothetical protein